MINQPFFTIVIPNYKTEPFLEQCLVSVKNQTFKNFECILVNDESPGVEIDDHQNTSSSSAKYWKRDDYQNKFIPKNINLKKQWQYIFEKITNRDKRFNFIDQKNTGQGIARNRAIERAKGKRVVFLDCDDMLELNYLKKAYIKITELAYPSIVYGDIKTYLDGELFGFEKQMKHIPKKNNFKSMLVFPTWTFNPTNYFWEIDFIKEHDLFYPGKIHDDLEFIYKAVMKFSEIHGKKSLDNMIQIPAYTYYRIFPLQNSKAENYQADFFSSSRDFLISFKTEIYNLQTIYKILYELQILRFYLYNKKLLSKNRLVVIFSTLSSKFLTLISILIAKL